MDFLTPSGDVTGFEWRSPCRPRRGQVVNAPSRLNDARLPQCTFISLLKYRPTFVMSMYMEIDIVVHHCVRECNLKSGEHSSS
jgi:hypothetical protein